MARTARRSRRRRSGRRFGGGKFLSRDTIAAVGGAAASAIVGPMLGRMLPAQLGQSRAGQVAASVIIGALGYFALSKVHRTAALAFAGTQIGATVAAMMPAPAAPMNGFGEPDGVSYLPQLAGDEYEEIGEWDDAEEIAGYNADAVEYVPS